MENNKFIKVCIKNSTCYYFDDVIIFEDFHFDTLIDEKYFNLWCDKRTYNLAFLRLSEQEIASRNLS